MGLTQEHRSRLAGRWLLARVGTRVFAWMPSLSLLLP